MARLVSAAFGARPEAAATPRSLLRRRPVATLSLLCALLAGGLLLLSACDPRDYWTVQPLVGPFAGRGPETAADAVVSPPPPVTAFAPGAQVAWISTFCVHPGNTIHTAVVLLRDGQTVLSRTNLWTDAQRRCGPMWGSLRLPADLPAGRYALSGVAIARADTWAPIRREVWRFGFDVTGPPGDAGPGADGSR